MRWDEIARKEKTGLRFIIILIAALFIHFLAILSWIRAERIGQVLQLLTIVIASIFSLSFVSRQRSNPIMFSFIRLFVCVYRTHTHTRVLTRTVARSLSKCAAIDL